MFISDPADAVAEDDEGAEHAEHVVDAPTPAKHKQVAPCLPCLQIISCRVPRRQRGRAKQQMTATSLSMCRSRPVRARPCRRRCRRQPCRFPGFLAARDTASCSCVADVGLEPELGEVRARLAAMADPRSLWMELVFLAALLAYAINYIVGRNTLGALVKKWLAMPCMSASLTGSGRRPRQPCWQRILLTSATTTGRCRAACLIRCGSNCCQIVRESASDALIYASGRRFCSRLGDFFWTIAGGPQNSRPRSMSVFLTFAKRQDLVTIFNSFFAPAYDLVTVVTGAAGPAARPP